MGFFWALRFLTIIPLPFQREVRPQEVGRSLGYFPLVGLGLGLALVGLDRLLALVFPTPLVNALVIIGLVVLSGALHLDGFIDTWDGVAIGGSREERLEVLRDSRVGSFGVVGACSLFLVKYLALAAIPQHQKAVALLLMPTLSRWAMAYSVFAYPYARKTLGLGSIFKGEANWQRMAAATFFALVISSLSIGRSGIVLMFGLWLFVLAGAAYFKSRLGGLTGDTYGAINEMSEVMVLLLLPFATRVYG